MGGTFDGVSGMMSSGLVRGLPLERFGSELLAHARCWVLRGRALVASVGRLVWLVAVSLWAFSWLHRLVGCGEGYRPYFENYTVDASIFESVFLAGS